MSALRWQDIGREILRDPDRILEERTRRRLGAFTARMFPGYTTAPHITILCDALESAARTPGSRVIVTMPPGHSKSLHVSEHFPAWYLGNWPDNRIITASHTAQLAYTFSRRVRNTISDPKWPFPGVAVAGDKSAVQAWDIAGRRGGYVATGVGSALAGHRAQMIIIDDYFGNAADAASETMRASLWEWWQGTLRDRLEPGGSIVVTATRWHMDDLTGRLLAAAQSGGEQWRHIHMPAIDEDGTALWPERWPIEALEILRVAVGSHEFEARFQGRPSPPSGGTFKREWWQFYDTETRPAIGAFDSIIQSWDMTFRETKTGSYVVGQVWGKLDARCYLLDQYRERVDFPGSLQAMRAMSQRWPMSRQKLVEDKANGPAVVATLKDEIPGLIEVSPEGGKEARANAVSWLVEAGNVYLPSPVIAPWVEAFIEEASGFPHGKHDDQVDAASQYLVYVTGGGTGFEALHGDMADRLRDMGLAGIGAY